MGNGQVERLNGTVWKAIQLALKSRNLPDQQWELVLTDVLHSLRSLLSTATNVTPHERFFGFPRRSSSGSSLPSWIMTPGPVLLRRFVRANKKEPLVDQVELLDANPTYAHIRHQDGRESTVSVRDLAPYPKVQDSYSAAEVQETPSSPLSPERVPVATHRASPKDTDPQPEAKMEADVATPLVRKSARVTKAPDRYGWD